MHIHASFIISNVWDFNSDHLLNVLTVLESCYYVTTNKVQLFEEWWSVWCGLWNITRNRELTNFIKHATIKLISFEANTPLDLQNSQPGKPSIASVGTDLLTADTSSMLSEPGYGHQQCSQEGLCQYKYAVMKALPGYSECWVDGREADTLYPEVGLFAVYYMWPCSSHWVLLFQKQGPGWAGRKVLTERKKKFFILTTLTLSHS